MINDSIKKLQEKILDLENKIEKIENNSINKLNKLGFTIFTKKLLNFKVLSRKKFIIANIDNKQKNNLFFQAKIVFYNYSEQEVQFDLFCDNIKIAGEFQDCNSGLNEISICGTYQNIVADKINIYLSANPKNKKQISIYSTTLTVWGISQTSNEEYDAIETNESIFLSYIADNRLYYKCFNKTLDELDFDFEFKEECISHSICKDNNDNLFLFKVDLDNNLFIENYQNKNELFISSKVNKVSSCYFDNSIYFSYITNGECYFGEIFNNVVISNKKLTAPFGEFVNCYLYSNKLNSKCYLILSKKDSSNYLLESVQSNFKSNENISAEIKLNIFIIKEGE